MTPVSAGTVEGVPEDLRNRDHVEELVVAFYEAAFRDSAIGPIFTNVAHMDLAAHLPVMCDFWETALFRAGRYRGSALRPHQRVHDRHRLTAAHFLRWLTLWNSAIDEMYRGPVADHARIQAARIAHAMHRRLTGDDSSGLDELVRQGLPTGTRSS